MAASTARELLKHQQHLLDQIVTAIGEVVAGNFDPVETLGKLSHTLSVAIPHDFLDVRYIDDRGDGAFSVVESAKLPRIERPARSEPLEPSLISSVLTLGEPLILADATDPVLAERASARERRLLDDGLRSCLSVPLTVAGRVHGAVELWSRRPAAFDGSALTTMMAVAERLGPVSAVVHLYRISEAAHARLSVIMNATLTIAQSLNLDDILNTIAELLTRTLGLPTCAIYLHDETRGVFAPRVAAGDGLPAHIDAVRLDKRFHETEFSTAVVAIDELVSGHPRVIEDPHGHPWFPEEFLADVPLVACMEVPLVVRERVVGLAALPLWTRGRSFSDGQLDVARGIAQVAAMAIEHARLYAQAREVGQVEERNRLAREVHDTLAQGLTAIALQLEAADRLLTDGSEAKRLVGEARALARTSLSEARRAVWGLSPSSLDGRSLGEVLAGEAVAFGRRSELDASFVTRGDVPTLGIDVATALLRVAQEALHNIEKHAHATRVRVELDATRPESLILLVADDGDGFEPDRPVSGDGGFGITSMRERMRAVGGDVDIESAVGWGTRIRASVPLAVQPSSPPVLASGPAEAIRVILADDHPIAREGVRRLLAERHDIVVAGEAANGAEAVELALELRPDVVLMDLQMPVLSGVGALRELRAAWPDVRVLMVTTFGQDELLFDALRAGARGYLLKDAGADELCDAIRTVHAGESLVQPVMTQKLLRRFGELADRDHISEQVTDRELEVLRLVAGGARNREIAERLVVSEKTVKYHLGQIFAKLAVDNRTQAVARARELGLPVGS